jgi:hypothetical protein
LHKKRPINVQAAILHKSLGEGHHVLRLQRRCWLLPGREVRGSGELGLRLEAGDPFAQRR